MKHALIIVVLSFCFALTARAQEEHIHLKTGEGDLEGTLFLPANVQKPAVVLLIAGSGPTDRNGNQGDMENNSLKMIAEGLAQKGIASVRYDKRGVGQSSDVMKDESELRFEDFSGDALGWINYLAADKRFSKVVAAGHSEGALIGMIAASKTKKAAGLVSIAGAGRPADELIKEQLQTVPVNIRDVVFPMIDKVKKGDSLNDVPYIFYPLLRPTVQPYMHSWFKYDPCSEIKKLKIPVLLIQGTADTQVSLKDAELLQKANPKATLKLISNMNHVLKDCTGMEKEAQKATYSKPDLPLHNELMEALCTFILSLP